MTKTERLYGVKPEKYREKQESLCKEKIRDAQILLAELRMQPYSIELEERYIEIEDAIKWNRKLLDELNT